MPKNAKARVPSPTALARAKPVGGGLLTCPIRGLLRTSELAADGLRPTEERRRIDFVKFLLGKGYPADHIKVETTLLRFGNKGRNSFRTDVAVFDVPVVDVPADVEQRKQHVRLVAEIKRDNAGAQEAKATQVRPALDFIPDLAALAVYWDDVEQRLFYKVQTGTKTRTLETAAALLPRWGRKLGTPVLTFADLRSTNIRTVFQKIEDLMHAEVPDKSARFEIMLQLLLTKLHDEHLHRFAKSEMAIQDMTDAPASDATVKSNLEKLLVNAVDFYGKYLPSEHPVAKKFRLSGARLRELTALLAPITIFGTRRAVLQDFYMYFAQHLYKWDMAQYFTPTEAVDFIVALANPSIGDTVRDPACGSGDFLISALHYVHAKGGRLHDAIWGSDNSPQAIQVCVLNMVLNGDGKSLLRREDSLQVMPSHHAQYSLMLCNPPFGVRILEKRSDVLQGFALGHVWERDSAGCMQQTPQVLSSQQTGILFAELCVRQTLPGGRVGLVMPNGYLGNGSPRYVAFREWLLRHTKLAAVVGFPRFTFKKSGADVSASALILERREAPLRRAVESEDYPFFAALLESVGWSAGDKRSEPMYRRDPENGEPMLDDQNEPILDADFDRVLEEFRASAVAREFPWAVEETSETLSRSSTRIADVLGRPDLSIDPKRWSRRCMQTREAVLAAEHFRLGDVLDVLPEKGKREVNDSAEYRYVAIEQMSEGSGTPTLMRGWQLPDRAKHVAAAGDIFVGGIWSSVGTWYVASGDCANLRVTNGCIRLRMKQDKLDYLLDVLAGLSTETYRIQARAFCTGSDGLADLSPLDLCDIVLPSITDPKARETLKPMVSALLAGRQTIPAAVAQLVNDGRIPPTPVAPRTSHMVQV